MKIEARRNGPIAVLVPEGQITIGAPTDALRAAIESALAQGVTHLLVEGSRVRYMDSSGMGELIAAARRLAPAGGRVGIAAPSPKLREILEITRLSVVFVVADTEQDAVTQMLAPTQ